MATEIIKILFTNEDVRAFAESANIDFDTAMERAENWAKHIAETATQLVNEQLESVIKFDQP